MRPETGRRASGPPADDDPSPPAAGIRLAWSEAPAPLRRAIEADLGSPAAQAVTTSAQPWRMDELARVLDALADLARSLTPLPCEAPTVADPCIR